MGRLDQVKMFVLDMDGTIYLGERLFPFTKDFLRRVRETGRDFCFFTNNSSKNRGAYLEKLARMGIEVPPEKMLISNGVILEWLKEHHPGASCYVVGTPPLREDFRQAGFVPDDPEADVVVLGFDTTLTYEKLRIACDLVRAGRPVYGVNPDWNCPVEGGFIPDCGSIAALVKASTGVQCEFFGKPSPHTLQYMLRQTGCRPEELAVVGDRLYTDIAVTSGSEAMGILVMSGETTPEILAQSETKPDLVVRGPGGAGRDAGINSRFLCHTSPKGGFALEYVNAFWVGGLICVAGQLLIDLTRLTPAPDHGAVCDGRGGPGSCGAVTGPWRALPGPGPQCPCAASAGP